MTTDVAFLAITIMLSTAILFLAAGLLLTNTRINRINRRNTK